MPSRPRFASAGNGLHHPERESTPYWRRETSWKKYLDPRHPLTRLGLGILLSGVPVVGTTIIFLTLCYFGFAKKKGEWISGIAVAVVIAGFSVAMWFYQDISVSNYSIVFGSTFTKTFAIMYCCMMTTITIFWLVLRYKHRPPRFRLDVEQVIELGRTSGRSRTPPPDDGAYARRARVGLSNEGDRRSLLQGAAPFVGAGPSRPHHHQPISVQIPPAVLRQPDSESSGSSSAVSDSSISPIHHRPGAGHRG